MDSKKIEVLEKFVESELALDNTGHGIMHAKRVMKNAETIIKKERKISSKVDYDIVIAACLLHDVADHKMFTDLVAQTEKITNALLQIDFSMNNIAEIIDIIHTISYRDGLNSPLTSLNAMIVRDADRLDALGSMGIIRCISYGVSCGRPFYEEANILKKKKKKTFGKSTATSLSHFYDKLLKLPGLMHTNVGKRMAKERIKIIEKFLKSFYREL